MKILPLLSLGCCSIIVVLSESTVETSEKALLTRASAQLERLAPYRRTSKDQQTTSDEQWQSLDDASKDHVSRILNEQRTAFEIYKLLPENLQMDVAKRIGANRATIELLGDPRYMELMQDRIKRSGTKRETYAHDGYEQASPPDGYPHDPYGGYAPEGYDGGQYGYPEKPGSDSGAIIQGSTSLIGGIAKGIIGGLVSASGTASKGSSSISASSAASSSSASSSSSDNKHKKPEYGQTYSYDDKAFDVWDFKKAIISTLMQAVKAISGGVIALKGQILKGSGYLISTKGRMVAKAGDAITTLGRNIVKSAVQPPHPQPPHPGYPYDHPPEGGHDETYDGPPPGIEEFAEQNDEYHESSSYESPSDVDDQAGLLIMKPTIPDGHDHHTVDTDSRKPSLTQQEDSYHGPPPGLPEKDVESVVLGSADYSNYNEENHLVTESEHRPPSSYEVPIRQNSLNDPTKGHEYPLYPPLDSDSPVNPHNPFTIQQSVEYPPLHLQYALPNKGGFDLSNENTSDNDLSVYSSFSIGMDPKLQSVKVSALKYGNGFELPKSLPHVSLQGLPTLSKHTGLQEPLKIPLLTPFSMPYWQNQGLFQPYANFDTYGWYRRRSGAQRRRSISDIAHRMRLRSG